MTVLAEILCSERQVYTAAVLLKRTCNAYTLEMKRKQPNGELLGSWINGPGTCRFVFINL